MKITPKFGDQQAYHATFFETLAVDVAQTTSATDEFASILDAAFGTAGSLPAAAPRAWIHKTYWLSDRRYKPYHKSWALSELIVRLEQVADLGPVREKLPDDHGSFTVERSRPEDKLVTVNHFGVCLNDWGFEPLYVVGRYDLLLPAINALEDVQSYLVTEGLA